MNLKDLMVDTKSAWIDFPGMKGFEVEVTHLSRSELTKLRKRCITHKFDRSTRQQVEHLDEEKFVDQFTKAVITNWSGLKLKYLEELLPVDLSNADPEEELAYSPDNAKELVSGSTEFDQWLNEVVFDLQNFRGKRETGSNKEA